VNSSLGDDRSRVGRRDLVALHRRVDRDGCDARIGGKPCEIVLVHFGAECVDEVVIGANEVTAAPAGGLEGPAHTGLGPDDHTLARPRLAIRPLSLCAMAFRPLAVRLPLVHSLMDLFVHFPMLRRTRVSHLGRREASNANQRGENRDRDEACGARGPYRD
jgi:hypothetical protein